jgi:hypothetical protein
MTEFMPEHGDVYPNRHESLIRVILGGFADDIRRGVQKTDDNEGIVAEIKEILAGRVVTLTAEEFRTTAIALTYGSDGFREAGNDPEMQKNETDKQDAASTAAEGKLMDELYMNKFGGQEAQEKALAELDGH